MGRLFLSLFLLVFFNCNKTQQVSEAEAVMLSAPEPPSNVSEKLMPDPSSDKKTSPAKTDTIARKIIKNGEMTIQIGDIKKARDQVDGILKKNQAYIQTEKFSNTDTEENLSLIIRIPYKNFDALINSFSSDVGSVISKNVSSNDVTEEYTDVSIRLANKRIYLEKYRDMLKSAATTKDILEIQENIRELEDEIDVAEGKLRFIDDRVNHSTLNLTLYREKIRSSATSKIGFGNRFADSLTEGWNSFVSFFLGLISLWPFLLIIPFIIFVWKKWKRRNKK
ncbi:DUF4349 domain-containing protein [Chryseobacterium gossypii]|uniref:DUF4349 domain-containing protein n=1 Tax=Chryseobacterium gossypii TaxID=3231602 RepID=UPI0035257690